MSIYDKIFNGLQLCKFYNKSIDKVFEKQRRELIMEEMIMYQRAAQ